MRSADVIVSGIILIILVGSFASYDIMSEREANLPPTSLYQISFYGEASITHDDLLYTFKSSVLNREEGDTLDFRLTATNFSNVTKGFYDGEATPLIYIYKGKTRVSFFAKARVIHPIIRGHGLEPGQSDTLGWTWGSGSYSSPQIKPGVYNVSASFYYIEPVGKRMTDLESPGVLMYVSAGTQPIPVDLIPMAAATLIAAILIVRISFTMKKRQDPVVEAGNKEI